MKFKTLFINLLVCSSLFFSEISSEEDYEEVEDFEKYYNLRREVEDRTKRLINISVDPCDDFYEYACGNWNNVHPIPEYEIKFDILKMLDHKTYEDVNELLDAGNDLDTDWVEPEEIVRNHEEYAETKILDFYKSCMETDEIERRGAEPLLNLLENFGGWPVLKNNWIVPNNYDWLSLVGKVLMYDVHVLLERAVASNLSNNNQNIIYIDRPSLLHFDEILSIEKIQTTLKLLGVNEETANQTAININQFEEKIHAIPKSEIKLENILHCTLEDLQNNYTSVNWIRYIEIATNLTSVTNETKVAIVDLEYLDKVMNFIQGKQMKDIVNYIMWYLVDKHLDLLDDRFQNVAKTFRLKTEGLRSPPRWVSCIKQTIDNMGIGVSTLYVKRKNINIEDVRTDLSVIATHIKGIYYAMLVNWMDKKSLDEVGQKLDRMLLKIGHDDFILNDTYINQMYQNYQIESTKYFENVISMRRLGIDKNLHTLKNEGDKVVPPFPAIQAEAFYNLLSNQVVFLGGLLRSPFYSPLLPQFYKYGGIGLVIAHEIMHGFDKMAREFDAFGIYKENFLSEKSKKHFLEMDDCLLKQYDSYSIDGHKLNAKYTLKENFADNLGLKLAFYSYRHWLILNKNLSQSESIDGLNLTNTQLYFLAVAQNLCVTLKPEGVAFEIENEPHATGKYRMIGEFVNSEEFANEFKCPIGSKMNPINKCKLGH